MSNGAQDSAVPTESDYLAAWARFIGQVSDAGAEVSNVVRDPASGGFTYAMRIGEADEMLIDEAQAQLRTVEIPFVIARLGETRGRLHEDLTVSQLHQDALMAAEQGLRFAVYGLDRTKGRRGRPVDIEQAGEFDDPAEAINHARSLEREEAGVSINGYPYWSSLKPDAVQSSQVERALFETQAGQEQTYFVTQQRHVLEQRQRIKAIMSVTPSMVSAIQGATSDMDAIAALTAEPHRLTALQARHVLMNLGLRNLTGAGRAQLEQQLEELVLPDPAGLQNEGGLDPKHTRANRDAIARRLEIAEGILSALTDPELLVSVVATAKNRRQANGALTEAPFSLEEAVAAHVLDTPFGRATEQARADLQAEVDELRQQLNRKPDPT